MPERVYLDWNATAPLAPAARDAVAAAAAELAETGRNPSSQHQEGRRARAMLEDARRRVAAAAGAEPEELVFTSGATEAANAVFAQGWDAVVVSAIEHDCVLAASERAAEAGAKRIVAPATPAGVCDLAALEKALAEIEGRALVAVMAANNETGALQPVAEAVRLARSAGAATLIDAAQAFGKVAFDFHGLGADFSILSGHKIGAPAGIGGLLIRSGRDFRSLLAGGGQETRRRAGTENLIGAIGFAAAAETIDAGAWAETAPLRDRLESALHSRAPDLVFFGQGIDRLPATSCFAAPGWRAETQLMQLDLAGFAVSAGSACSSGKLAASHVLSAMGADAGRAESAIRVSFGPEMTEEALERFAAAYLRLHARAAARRKPDNGAPADLKSLVED